MVRAAVRTTRLATAALLLLGQLSCTKADRTPDAPIKPPARINRTPFGNLLSGQEVSMFTLINTNGIELHVMDYGGIITSLKTPDRHGVLADIVLGYDNITGYLTSSPYFGAIVGRYANRIANGRFALDGKTYTLAVNNGRNSLHGGLVGFDKVMWHAESFDSSSSGRVGVVFSYISVDGEEGYPGTLRAMVTYTLTDTDELVIDYRATTDKATPVNLSQHSYFNLAGAGSGSIINQVISINADKYTPVDSSLIPTGVLQPVDSTPFDLRTPVGIGVHVNEQDRQLKIAGGYDHNFVLNRAPEDSVVLAARAFDPGTGRVLEVSTTEPGLQFYSGNFLDASIRGKNNSVYARRSGFCLETQHFPDSPNQKAFPSAILRPSTEYRSRTVYSFRAQESGTLSAATTK